MRRTTLIAVFAVLLCVTPAGAGTALEIMLAGSLKNYVQPAYASLVEATGKLEISADTLCRTSNAENLAAAQAAFKKAALAWSHIEWFRTGAVMNDNRVERMFYFPDRKGTGLKQVQAALEQRDPDAARSDRLAVKSVAMQGLGASEFLLFSLSNKTRPDETFSGPHGAYRCAYILASAQTMSAIAQDVSAQWQPGRAAARMWQNPTGDNPYFRSDAEALNVMIGTLVHGLEAVRDTRLAVFTGKAQSADRPKAAAFWRSEQTFAAIAANLEGLRAFYESSHIKLSLPVGHQALVNTIRFDFDRAIKTAKDLDAPVKTILSNPALREKAVYLQLTVQILINHFSQEFAVAAGITPGFSFGDGD
jgi:uncharacterized protein